MKCSEETRAKISIANKGRKPSLSAILASVAARKGKKLSDEHKAKIALAGVGNKYSVGKKPWNFGLATSPETREKISLNNARWRLGKKFGPHPEELRKRMSAARLGKSISTKGKKKPSISGANHYAWKGGINRYHAYRARKRGASGTHTIEQWGSLKTKYSYICLCCKQQEPFIKLSEDHIVPLSMGGTNEISNIQPLCLSCNSRKRDRTINYSLNVSLCTLK